MIKKFVRRALLVLAAAAVILTVLPLSGVGSVASAASYNCTNPKLQSLIDQWSGRYWNGSYANAYKCKGFADKMYDAMNGGTKGIGRYNYDSTGRHYYIPSPNGARELAKSSRASYQYIYDVMHKARSGDYVQWSRGSSQHSGIFVSCDEKGFYLFDCNYISPNLCGVHYITFEKLANKNRGMSIYTVYPADESSDSGDSDAQKTTVKVKETTTEKKAVTERKTTIAAKKTDTAAEKKTTATTVPSTTAPAATAETQKKTESAKKTEVGAETRSSGTVSEAELSFKEVASSDRFTGKSIVGCESSNSSVVVVSSDGGMIGIAAGTAVVTLIASDGSRTACKITVNCPAYLASVEYFINSLNAVKTMPDQI